MQDAPRRASVLAHLAHDHHRFVLELLQLGQAFLQRTERNVAGIGNVAFAKFLAVAHIQHQGAFPVHQMGELMSGNRFAAAPGFQQDEQNHQDDERAHQFRMVDDEFEQTIH